MKVVAGGPHRKNETNLGGLKMKRLMTICAVVCTLSVGLTGIVHADVVTLSTRETETLGGIAFEDGSLVDYDTVADTATLRFNENKFDGNGDIDAVHVLDNGHYILSTDSGATLGGLTFRDGDLIDYNPIADTATLFFNEDLFAANEDIDAVHVLDNSHIILSTSTSASLGGTLLDPGDLVDYDPVAGTASLFLRRQRPAFHQLRSRYRRSPRPRAGDDSPARFRRSVEFDSQKKD